MLRITGVIPQNLTARAASHVSDALQKRNKQSIPYFLAWVSEPNTHPSNSVILVKPDDRLPNFSQALRIAHGNVIAPGTRYG